MPLTNATLFDLRGRVLRTRPKIPPPVVDGYINDRLRQLIDARPFWSDLLKTGILSIPAEYKTGTVSLTTGSAVVNGVTTAWPTNDIVNTTIPNAVVEVGYLEITPASMAGINTDSLLYVDAAGTPEIVAVQEVTSTSFFATFRKFHNANATVTQSSLAGRQFRMGSGFPIYTIRAVKTATQLELDNPWGGAALTAQTYQILKMYFTLADDLKDILNMVDTQWGYPVRLHVSQAEIDWRDPQRTATGLSGVLSLVDLFPNENGNMQYAIWPPVTSEKQLPFIYVAQWPPLEKDTDRLPHFINPSLFYHGALADALRYRSSKDDPFYNPREADHYEQRFRQGFLDALNADESKAQRAYTFAYDQLFGAGGANFWQSHDPDVMLSNF